MLQLINGLSGLDGEFFEGNPKEETTTDMVTNRHYQLDNLLRFLDDPDIEPTNSRAERMLLPTVITRKISQCSQTDSSAHTYAAFKSVLTTYALQAIDSVSTTLRELIAGNRDSTAPQAS